MTSPTTWRYDLPSIKFEGWAKILLTSDGIFAAVSDFGNYALRWTAWGDGDFRAFILDIGADYLLSKIADEVYDAEATERAVKKRIIEMRREGGEFTKEWAREEWETLEYHGVGSETCFAIWSTMTRLNADGLDHWTYSSDARNFAEKTMLRLTDAIRAQLHAEGAL